MLFNSLHFLLFFPMILLITKFTHRKYRIYITLLASYYFYMSWKIEYIGLILLSTIVDYFVSKKICKTNSGRSRKILLITSIVSNLTILFIFKYYNFFAVNFNYLLSLININLNITKINMVLPVGISFYTFQTLSYTFDVYYRRIEAEKKFLNFALYVSYWPQLIAGPIERAGTLLPQLKEKIQFRKDLIEKAVTLIAFGFFKKLVIADRLAIYVDAIYNAPTSATPLALLIATYFFAIQIYCDFSGYTDIARGCSWLIGIDLMENFRQPYFAGSITNFWKRWHISLTSWFTQYLYIPLGGNKISKNRTYLNLFIVFLVSGLWHGANWTFLAWGFLHGLFLISEKIFKYGRDEIKKINHFSDLLKIFITFHLVLLTWVFFRSKDIQTSIYIIKKIIFDFKFTYQTIGWSLIPFTGDNLAINNFLFSIIAIAFLIFIEWKKYQLDLCKKEFKSINLSLLFILLLIFFGEFYKNSFIYFQF